MLQRTLVLATLLVSALSSALPAAEPTAAPAVPPRDQAPNDTAEYRRFNLDNGLKVLLLSDAKLNKSAGSLVVGVGSYSEPIEHQGLAHFLEHMLFLGTEKYPNEAEYSNYLQSNGGYANAYTANDRTNYQFEIRHEALEGALDRFAQFFIAPLLTPEFTERELNAVNSEFQLRLENDSVRESVLVQSFYRKDHPANHFSWGNRESLAGTKREDLLAFYQAHYSADNMALVVTGKASLDQLEHWVRTSFSAIVNRQVPPPHLPADYLPPKAALRLIRMEPLKDLRELNLEFPLPASRQYYASKPGELLGFILGYEGEGSLLSQLKAAGLATGISAGASSNAAEFGSFNLSIKLTPAGLGNYPRVLGLVFSAVARLHEAGYPSYLFKERQAMARLGEKYGDRGEGANVAANLSNLVLDHPLAIAERVPYLWLQEDPAAYKLLLDQLRPDNLLVTLIAKGVVTDQTEHYFGTRYSYSEDSGSAYTSLLHPAVVAGILPRANSFVPTTAALRPVQPINLISEPALDLYYAQDTEFQRPMVGEIYRFLLPRSMASRENSVLLKFYATCVNEILNETAYAAGEAGLNLAISAGLEGVTISLSGYDESSNRLRDKIAANLVNLELSPERFAALKDKLVQEYASFPRLDAFRIIQQTAAATSREFNYRQDEQLPVAQGVTLAAVQAFAKQLYIRGKIQAMIYGNVTATDAITAARSISSALKVTAVPAPDLLKRNLLVMKPGESIRTNEKLVGNNSVYWREYHVGDDRPELRAIAMCISNFISEPYYTEMRTKQQLGYIVWSGADILQHTTGAYFIIQSGEHPADDLEAKSEAFVATLPGQLASLSDEAWATIKAGVRAKLLEKDKTVADRAGRFFELAYNLDADWGRDEATLQALDSLSKTRCGEILAQTLAADTHQKLTFLGFARNHEPKAAPAVSFTDREAWKKTRKFE